MFVFTDNLPYDYLHRLQIDFDTIQIACPYHQSNDSFTLENIPKEFSYLPIVITDRMIDNIYVYNGVMHLFSLQILSKSILLQKTIEFYRQLMQKQISLASVNIPKLEKQIKEKQKILSNKKRIMTDCQIFLQRLEQSIQK